MKYIKRGESTCNPIQIFVLVLPQWMFSFVDFDRLPPMSAFLSKVDRPKIYFQTWTTTKYGIDNSCATSTKIVLIFSSIVSMVTDYGRRKEKIISLRVWNLILSIFREFFLIIFLFFSIANLAYIFYITIKLRNVAQDFYS